MYNNNVFSNYGAKKNTISSKKIIIENILKEYQLKRNNFNPTTKSPNLFAVRLQNRMKLYYNSLLKS
tara:strand:- start:5905 stop:6105 length:201 start_codon:yes stop_codon:yes gene_type:complete